MKHHATVEQVKDLQKLGITFNKDEITEIYHWHPLDNYDYITKEYSKSIFSTLLVNEATWMITPYDTDIDDVGSYILPKPDLLSLINKLPKWIERPEDLYGINITRDSIRYISNYDKILIIGDRKNYNNHATFITVAGTELIDIVIKMLKFIKINNLYNIK